jgi:hypothetical protein
MYKFICWRDAGAIFLQDSAGPRQIVCDLPMMQRGPAEEAGAQPSIEEGCIIRDKARIHTVPTGFVIGFLEQKWSEFVTRSLKNLFFSVIVFHCYNQPITEPHTNHMTSWQPWSYDVQGIELPAACKG